MPCCGASPHADVRVYFNFTERRGPYGGANSFLRTLRKALRRRGVTVTDDPRAHVDVVLLNALTDEIDLAFVQRIAQQGAPIVHRKVGYRASGSPEMRAVHDGVVHGDKLQIEFSPFLRHTIFQSEYSRGVFLSSGFTGTYSIIHNGVDEDVFNPTERRLLGSRPRRPWDGASPLRVVVSTWSTDPKKGFEDYRRIDDELAGRKDVELTLVGRVPDGLRFRTFRVLRARPAARLAAELRRHHALLQLARYETCSNALIEGINCGLPAIYLDSGSNAEVAGQYGVEYTGDIDASLTALRARYAELVERIPENPYRSRLVVEHYLEVFEEVRA